jgi:hypothetical protein
MDRHKLNDEGRKGGNLKGSLEGLKSIKGVKGLLKG